MKNFKMCVALSPHSDTYIRLPEPVARLAEIVFVFVSGSFRDDFKVVSDGIVETFSYRLEHIRFLMGCENSGIIRIPDNYYFFNAGQLGAYDHDRYFEFSAENGGGILDMHCRYEDAP